MEWLADKNKARAIGELYFTAERDDKGLLRSAYQGTIAGFIVRRDDGSEFEVRAERALPYSNKPLTFDEMKKLKVGDELQSVNDDTKYRVLRVYPVYGDVWVKDLATGKNHAKKSTDLRHVQK